MDAQGGGNALIEPRLGGNRERSHRPGPSPRADGARRFPGDPTVPTRAAGRRRRERSRGDEPDPVGSPRKLKAWRRIWPRRWLPARIHLSAGISVPWKPVSRTGGGARCRHGAARAMGPVSTVAAVQGRSPRSQPLGAPAAPSISPGILAGGGLPATGSDQPPGPVSLGAVP